MTSRSHARPP